MTDAGQAVSVGDVVCRRDLTRSAGGRESTVSVSVLRPVPEGNHFACEFRIEGLGSRLDPSDELPYVARAFGIDAMQALLIAFQGIRLALRPHERELAWLGGPSPHGVPLIVSFLYDDGAEYYAKIEAMVERETERFLAKMIRRKRRPT